MALKKSITWDLSVKKLLWKVTLFCSSLNKLASEQSTLHFLSSYYSWTNSIFKEKTWWWNKMVPLFCLMYFESYLALGQNKVAKLIPNGTFKTKRILHKNFRRSFACHLKKTWILTFRNIFTTLYHFRYFFVSIYYFLTSVGSFIQINKNKSKIQVVSPT